MRSSEATASGTGDALPGRGAGPLLAAHRGGSLCWPENSLLAFRNALALGVDFLELDVHLSRDKEAVVIHDPALDRTTTGAGAVGERALAELRALRLREKSGVATDEAIPTLEEVVGLAAPTGVRLLLEIKVDARRQRYPGIEEKALAILERHQMGGRTIVIAFEQETLRQVHRLKRDVVVGGLCSPRSLRQTHSTADLELAILKGLGAKFAGLHQELVTEPVVAQARKAGLLLAVWTVNDAAAMKRFSKLGVDILVTDRPDLAKEVLGR